MYCINCGVKLADSQRTCPLCQTEPIRYLEQRKWESGSYPQNRQPDVRPKSGAVNGCILTFFLICAVVTGLVDLQTDKKLSWFGFAAGGMLLAYVVFALPLWFQKPNPVIFVPCSFGAACLYLLYMDLATTGTWFLPFAFPVTAAFGLLATAAVTLLRYIHGGRLYIIGGGFIALGGMLLLVESLLVSAFERRFVGWSLYPLFVLFLLGGLLIFLAINKTAREVMERKFFI